MGVVMIRCPATEKVISTGLYIDSAAFHSMPVFFGTTLCPLCRISKAARGIPTARGGAWTPVQVSAILHLSACCNLKKRRVIAIVGTRRFRSRNRFRISQLVSAISR